MTDREQAVALDIIEILARDVERQVREALAEHIKHCPFLPPRIAQRMAADVLSVALPIVRYSPVLGERDLLLIVREGIPEKLYAVAERDRITPRVCDAVIGTGVRAAVVLLLGNPEARPTETGHHRLLDDFELDTEVQGLMVERPTLPLSVTVRLIDMVSSALRRRLIARHEIPAELVSELVGWGRDRALVDAIASAPSDTTVTNVVDELFEHDSIPGLLLLRAACSGEFRVVELGMAMLAGIPADRVRRHLEHPGQRMLAWLYRRAGLPGPLYRAFCVALDVRGELDSGGVPYWRPRFTERVMDRLAAEYDVDRGEDLEHLLSQLARQVTTAEPSEAARDRATARSDGAV